MLTKPKIAAAILAAGESSRFKPGPKALPPPRGGDLLNMAVSRLNLVGFSAPVVVVNPAQPEVAELAGELGCQVAENPNPEEGMFSSAKIALQAAGDGAALILPVDAAFIAADSYLSVMAHFLFLPERDKLAVVPAKDLRLGHPPLIGSALIPKILAYGGPGGLRGALASLAGDPAEAAAVMDGATPKGLSPFPGEGAVNAASRLRYLWVEDPQIHCDVDTREDLEAAQAMGAFTMDPYEPSPKKALAFLRMVGPERKFGHSLAVALAAARLNSAIKGFCENEVSLSFIGGLLHDICHGQRGHAEAGRKLILAMGWSNILAEAVGNHTELSGGPRAAAGLPPAPEPESEPAPKGQFVAAAGQPSQREIHATLCVYLADKFLKGAKLVDLETRFNPDWAKRRLEAWPFIMARKADTLKVVELFNELLNRPLEEVLVAPVADLAELELLASQSADGPVIELGGEPASQDPAVTPGRASGEKAG
ncbi:MAG: NTP transferase domain-containing protein [Deltaproteobacteria bacterium]|jgi:CTP:molybdopterin cytidylyltransferase MocA|nr:NTP transferase domain-containing protein [Deltaproteobacteria bacterium]